MSNSFLASSFMRSTHYFFISFAQKTVTETVTYRMGVGNPSTYFGLIGRNNALLSLKTSCTSNTKDHIVTTYCVMLYSQICFKVLTIMHLFHFQSGSVACMNSMYFSKDITGMGKKMEQTASLHRGMICQFPVQQIYN